MLENSPPHLSRILIQLLQGVLYQEPQPDIWQHLLSLRAQISDYINVIGLDLIIDEAEGYAYLRQKPMSNAEDQKDLPKLIQSRPLSFSLSLLCVLLRKKLLEQDALGGEIRVILTEQQIIEMMQLYLPSGNNEVKTINQILTAINKAIDLGVLRRLSTDEKRYEVKRIIKALIDAEWLTEMEQKLKEYHEYAQRHE